MTTYSRIKLFRLGPIATILLCADGDVFLTAKLGDELDEATAALEADSAVRVVILTGWNKGVFARHYSVRELIALAGVLRKQGFTPSEDLPRAPTGLDRAIDRLSSMAKPTIAAINGEAMGGGFEIALGCDIRIARKGHFRIGQPETALGIMPGAGGTQRLARVVGEARALAHDLIGAPISPDEALRQGFVHELANDPLRRASHIAALLNVRPAAALAHTKRMCRAAHHLPLAEGLRLERNLFLDLVVRDEALDFMQAYLDEKLLIGGRTVYGKRPRKTRPSPKTKAKAVRKGRPKKPAGRTKRG